MCARRSLQRRLEISAATEEIDGVAQHLAHPHGVPTDFLERLVRRSGTSQTRHHSAELLLVARSRRGRQNRSQLPFETALLGKNEGQRLFVCWNIERPAGNRHLDVMQRPPASSVSGPQHVGDPRRVLSDDRDQIHRFSREGTRRQQAVFHLFRIKLVFFKQFASTPQGAHGRVHGSGVQASPRLERIDARPAANRLTLDLRPGCQDRMANTRRSINEWPIEFGTRPDQQTSQSCLGCLYRDGVGKRTLTRPAITVHDNGIRRRVPQCKRLSTIENDHA